MNVYEKVKNMSMEEMKNFIYWVYLSGNKDGRELLMDDPDGYFGGHVLTIDAETLFPNGCLDNPLLYDLLRMEDKNIMKVICIRERFSMPRQITVGEKYEIDGKSIYIDEDGDAYGMVYHDGNRIANLRLSHFRSIL